MELLKFKDIKTKNSAAESKEIRDAKDILFSNYTAAHHSIDESFKQLRKKINVLVHGTFLPLSNQSKDQYLRLRSFIKELREDSAKFK